MIAELLFWGGAIFAVLGIAALVIDAGKRLANALDVVKRRYEERDGWPLGPERLDPHRTVAPAAWRGPVEPRPSPKNRDRKRERLINLIMSFEHQGLSFFEDDAKCDASSAHAAITFVNSLPDEYRLPKISVDGEGGVILAWKGNIVMSVNAWTIHAVVDPAGDARYLCNIDLREGIPDELLRYIPKIPLRAACKIAGQPVGFVVDPWQTIDRLLAKAKVGLLRAGRWLSERWQQGVMLVVFGLITAAVFLAYGHWSVRLWLDAIQ